MVYANPDFIELNDGRILLAYQWRYKKGYNDLAHTNENCGVGIMTSSDGGRSWSKARSVYRGRCWEPAMLQLPSGEIQMYITSSQNVVNGLSCPRTVVIRSFDGGETWQENPSAASGIMRSFRIRRMTASATMACRRPCCCRMGASS